jgi:hypothetical protein
MIDITIGLPATLRPTPEACATALLDGVARALAARGWECLAHEACDGEAMLVATAPQGATWLLTGAAAGLRAQRMAGEAWLETVCEGPPARILACLAS